MNNLDLKQYEGDELWLRIHWHIAKLRRYFWVIILLTLLGLIIGVGIQRLSKDTYVGELSIRQGDRLHLTILKFHLQPTTVHLFKNGANGRDADSIRTNPTASKINSDGTKDATEVIIYNQLSPRVDRIEMKQPKFTFKVLDLEILKRIANGSDAKLTAIMNLDKSDPLRIAVKRNKSEQEKALGKFKIFNISKKSKVILIRYEGSSIQQSISVVENLAKYLNDKYVALEKQRIAAALRVKLTILNAQIVGRKEFVQQSLKGNQNKIQEKITDDTLNNDPILITLFSDRKIISEFSIKDNEIKPFIILPTKRFKKFRLSSTNMWLVLTTISGFLLGIFCCYVLDKIRVVIGGATQKEFS